MEKLKQIVSMVSELQLMMELSMKANGKKDVAMPLEEKLMKKLALMKASGKMDKNLVMAIINGLMELLFKESSIMIL